MNVEEIIKEITSTNDEETVLERIDDQSNEYLDDDWDEGGEYDSSYEWYVDHGNGEAEDDIVNELIASWKKEHGNLIISSDDIIAIFTGVKAHWDL